MAQALILDSEALNALARSSERPRYAERTRAILRVAHDEGASVRVPAPVLAEVCRGRPADAAVHRVLNAKGITVMDLTDRIAQRAGSLLERAKLGSAHAVDAFIVATALEFGSTVIATGDPDDITRLSAWFRRQIRVFRV